MRYSALLYLTLLSALSYMDRYLLPALLPVIAADLGLTHEQGGRLVSSFVFGYFIFSPIFGFLGDRVKRQGLMAFGLILWSAATIWSGFATNYNQFLLARACVGIGEASFCTIAPGYIKDRVQDPIRLNRYLAVFCAAIPVGSALGYVLAGYLNLYFDWHKSFLIAGVPGLFLAIGLFMYREVRVAPAEHGGLKSLKMILRTKTLVFSVLGYVLNNFALVAIAAFISDVGMQIGFTHERITTSFGIILVLSGFFGTIGGGNLASRLAKNSRQPMAVMLRFAGVLTLLAVPACFLVFILKTPLFFSISCFVAELLVFAALAPINSIIVLSAPAGTVTLAQGFTIFMLNLLGSLPAPILVGYLADRYSLPYAMQICTLMLFLSGIIWYRTGLNLGHRSE